MTFDPYLRLVREIDPTPALERRDGVWRCLRCGATHRVEVGEEYPAPEHKRTCPLISRETGVALHTAMKLEERILELLESCERLWEELDDGVEHDAASERRVADWIWPALMQLRRMRPFMQSLVAGVEPSWPEGIDAEEASRPPGATVLALVRALFQEGEAILEAGGHYYDHAGDDEDEHARLDNPLYTLLDAVVPIAEVLTDPRCRWEPIVCPECETLCNADGECTGCDNQVEPYCSLWDAERRAFAAAHRCPNSPHHMIGRSGHCCYCDHVDRALRAEHELGRRRIRAALRERGHIGF